MLMKRVVHLINTSTQNGGCLSIAFVVSSVPSGLTSINKHEFKPSITCGSTVAGEPIPPHFKIKFKSKTNEEGD